MKILKEKQAPYAKGCGTWADIVLTAILRTVNKLTFFGTTPPCGHPSKGGEFLFPSFGGVGVVFGGVGVVFGGVGVVFGGAEVGLKYQLIGVAQYNRGLRTALFSFSPELKHEQHKDSQSENADDDQQDHHQ